MAPKYANMNLWKAPLSYFYFYYNQSKSESHKFSLPLEFPWQTKSCGRTVTCNLIVSLFFLHFFNKELSTETEKHQVADDLWRSTSKIFPNISENI